VRVLLDTHVVLWAMTSPARLGREAVAALSDRSTRRVVSAATLWEIATKSGIGRMEVDDDLPDFLARHGHEFLTVTPEHAWRVKRLPDVHRDPFDRLLVAQAQAEDIPLITHDRLLERYDLRIIRA
jgi:PIN domain nuclease of toxin-antitoxin system